SRRRHTRWPRDWSSDVCSSDLDASLVALVATQPEATVLEAAHAAARAGILARGTKLRFSHELYRAALYRDVDAAKRARVHGAIEIGRASCRERVPTTPGAH